jgi:putative phosphoesterase
MAKQDTETATGAAPLLTIGVIADTHIPDRVRKLHPSVLPIFQEAQVSHILHAGDISTREVLDDLRQVASVTAVCGNRDIFAGRLKLVEEIELGGVRLTLMHSHGGWIPYLWDKWKYWKYGYRLERYLPRLLAAGKHSHVVVFGHTHHPVTVWQDGKMLYNPGSASFGPMLGKPPTLGLLRIFSGGKIEAETRPLFGYTIRSGNWERNS